MTDTINTNLRAREKTFSIMRDQTLRYFELVKKFVLSSEPERYRKMISIETIVFIGPTDLDESLLANGYNLFEQIRASCSNMNFMKAIVDDDRYYNIAVSMGKLTHAETYTLIRHDSQKTYDNMLKLNTFDAEIISTYMKMFDLKKYAGRAIIYISETPRPNKFTHRIMGDLNVLLTGDSKRALEMIIEEQKNKILGARRRKLDTAGIDALIVRYTIPYTKFMPLEELVQMVGGNVGATHDEHITALLDAVDYVIVLHDGCFNMSVEFDTRGLLDEKYIVANHLEVASSQGLDEHVIAKYNTCTVAAAKPNAAAPLFLSKVAEIAPTAVGVIIQSVGSDNSYRLMSTAGGWRIPYYEISGIIDGLSMRAEQYNKLHTDAILSVCHDKLADVLMDQWKTLSALPVSADTLKSHILIDLEVWFRAHVGKIESKDDFVDLLLNQQVISKILFDRFQITKKHGFYAPEQTLTYLHKQNTLTTSIMRGMKIFLATVPIAARIFTEMNRVDLNKTLTDILLLGVSALLNNLDKLGEFNGFDLTIKEFYMSEKHVQRL